MVFIFEQRNPNRSATVVIAASNSLTSQADFVCDGTNDDIIINEAIDTLPTDGGRILLLEGTYNISSSINVNNSNIEIEGQGKGTILKLSDGSNTSIITITGISSYIYFNKIKNLCIDGNKANQTGTGHGIYLDKWASLCEIEGIYIYNCYTHGIFLNATKSTGLIGPGVTPASEGDACYHCRITRCTVGFSGTHNIFGFLSEALVIDTCFTFNPGGDGIYLRDANSSKISNTWVNQLSNTGYGIHFYQTSSCHINNIGMNWGISNIYLETNSHNNVFQGVQAEGDGNALTLSAGNYNQFSGCKFNSSDGSKACVEIVGNSLYNKFMACFMMPTSYGSPGVHIHNGTSSYNSFISCNIQPGTYSAQLANYCVYEESPSNHNRFIYCDFSNTSPVSSTSGAATVFVPTL